MEHQHVLYVAIIFMLGLIVPGIMISRSGKTRAALWRFCISLFSHIRLLAFVRAPDVKKTRNVFDEVCRQYELTEREQDVARLIVQGRSNQQIAADLNVTVSTIKKHITKVYHKCNVTSRDELLYLCSSSSKPATLL